jgi:hypothetical protein
MKVVRALDGEPLRLGRRKETLYLVRGTYQAASGVAKLTTNVDHAETFLSESAATNVAKRMGLTLFEVIDL